MHRIIGLIKDAVRHILQHSFEKLVDLKKENSDQITVAVKEGYPYNRINRSESPAVIQESMMMEDQSKVMGTTVFVRDPRTYTLISIDHSID